METRLFGWQLIPILYLRLVEALSAEHQGDVEAVEQALHRLGRQMATPVLLALVRTYGQQAKDYFPTNPDTFLNRVDEYLSRNWQLATGTPPAQLEFTDDRTLQLSASPCPLCYSDTFQSGMKLRYCQLVAGVLEGLLQHWIDNLKLPLQAQATEAACRLQGSDTCQFRIHFSDKPIQL